MFPTWKREREKGRGRGEMSEAKAHMLRDGGDVFLVFNLQRIACDLPSI